MCIYAVARNYSPGFASPSDPLAAHGNRASRFSRMGAEWVHRVARLANRMPGTRRASTRGTRAETARSATLVYSPDPARKFIYKIAGMNGKMRVLDRAPPGRRVHASARPAGRAVHGATQHWVDRLGNSHTSEVRSENHQDR